MDKVVSVNAVFMLTLGETITLPAKAMTEL